MLQYIIVIRMPDSSTIYYGPFASEKKAQEYMRIYPTNVSVNWHVKELQPVNILTI